MPGDPFHIDVLPEAPLSRAAFSVARPLLERVLALSTYRALYRKAQRKLDEPFESRALRALEIKADVSEADLDLIPRTGPVIVAANHPHGVVDGLLLMSALRRIRPDIRVLTNQLLARIPELRDCCLFVDPFNGPSAEARSRAGLRAAHLWLRAGGALIVFPAGEVAHIQRAGGERADSTWKPAMSRLAMATGAPVIPAFIRGRNSRMFYAAGRVHPLLRTLLLPRELLKKRGSTLAVRFGPAIHVDQLAGGTPAATAVVRGSVESLADVPSMASATPHTTTAIAAEVAALSSDCRLLDSGKFQVFCARAEQIPAALREIGRLRAITFRAVGEGSDAALDLDRFDEKYLHLFLWDNDKRQIVGAYRLGQTDRIVADSGVDGLYTRTLFRYDERLIRRMPAPALELGRSFVRAEYQKSFSPLMLLWRGVGQFVVRNPRYAVLFGAVSISNRYAQLSRELMVDFLRLHRIDSALARYVKPRSPFRTRRPAMTEEVNSSHLQNLEELSQMLAQIESDGKGVPILLKQYLKLGGRMLGFNLDDQFGDALDGLVVVDLRRTDIGVLSHYMGEDGAKAFLRYHAEHADEQRAL